MSGSDQNSASGTDETSGRRSEGPLNASVGQKTVRLSPMNVAESDSTNVPPGQYLLRIGGLLVVFVVFSLIGVGYGFLILNWAFRLTDILIGILSGVATIILAAGILYQGFLIARRINLEQRERLQNQESQWIPEVRQPLQANWLVFSEARPWYPWFKIEVGERVEGWHDEVVRKFPSEETKEARRPNNWHEVMAWKTTDPDIDWYVPFPNSILKFFRNDLENGTHEGQLTFRFETLTGQDYFFVYYVKIQVTDSDSKIIETPYVQRYLPWEPSDYRDELREELVPFIEESRQIEKEN